jgi:voltage-gated sodium channel
MQAAELGIRARLEAFVTSVPFERFIIAVILVNGVCLGLETVPWAMEWFGTLLLTLDTVALAVFVVELTLKLIAMGPRFFRRAWNIFDLVIVLVSLAPASQGLSVLRSFRILRVLRLMSMLPSMRVVVQALLEAIPGMGSVVALLSLVFYVFAVMATKLFGAAFPEWFGSIGASLYSLFQIMTLESWSMGIVRPVMEVYPLAWAFFVPFILMTTFAVLNLFIAIIVNAMQSTHSDEAVAVAEQSHADHEALVVEIRELRREIAGLKDRLRENPPMSGENHQPPAHS